MIRASYCYTSTLLLFRFMVRLLRMISYNCAVSYIYVSALFFVLFWVFMSSSVLFSLWYSFWLPMTVSQCFLLLVSTGLKMIKAEISRKRSFIRYFD